MAAHQPSGSYNVSSGITVPDGVDGSVGTKKQKKNQLKVDIENGPNKNLQNKTDRREKVSSPESEWATTTDTSIHSTPTDHEVSNNVLEACDGMDEMSLASSPSRRSSSTSKGRGYKQKVLSKKLPTQEKTNQDPLSSDSSESSASDSEGESDSERALMTGSSDTSHSSSSSDETYPTLTSSSNTRSDGHCSSNCYSDCSCSCHEDYSSSSDSATSYESTDDLTDLPRVKKGGRLGHKGTTKVADQCAQS